MKQRLHLAFLTAALAFALAPCHAQEFVDDAWSALHLATLVADQSRGTCAELDPLLGAGLDTALARLREAHADELLAGRAGAQRRTGPDGVDPVARATTERFGQRLQQQDAEGRRAECGKLTAYLDASADRSRRDLVDQSFRRWFALQQRERHIDCAGLHETARSLAQRLLGDGAGDRPPNMDLLRPDARRAEQAAGWCQQVQGAAARERIHVAGEFALVAELARAISDAAMPLLSGRDPATAFARGRQLARRYLAEPDWL